MIDDLSIGDSSGEIEAIIRSAAGLPAVSADLRPRVLRAAMAGHRGRSGRRWAVVVVVVTLIFFLLSPPVGPPEQTDMAGRRPATGSGGWVAVSERNQRLASAEQSWGTGAPSSDWALVEGYCRLRRDHLRLLRQAF